jgi:dihydroorotate dehydrogenase electron transfer subunit
MNDYTGTVAKNRIVDESIHIIGLEVPGFNGIAEPGQFAMLKADDGYDPFLRRPYSIFGCSEGSMDFLVKIVGAGSECIALKPEGSELTLLAPLGKGFSLAEKGQHIIVAGGMGIAPLWFLASTMQHRNVAFSLIFGEQTHSQLGHMVDARFENARLVTDDGSYGSRGLATETLSSLMDEHAEEEITVYGCGPGAMLERLADIVKEKGVRAYISLETRMACGLGVCLGCSVKKNDGSGYITVCRDGPVFNAEEVIW